MGKKLGLVTGLGVFDDGLSTLLIAIQKKYIYMLETKYRPSLIICLEETSERFIQGARVEYREGGNSIENIEKIIGENVDEYNIIIHTDDDSELQKFMKDDVFECKKRNVGLSTGAAN